MVISISYVDMLKKTMMSRRFMAGMAHKKSLSAHCSKCTAKAKISATSMT